LDLHDITMFSYIWILTLHLWTFRFALQLYVFTCFTLKFKRQLYTTACSNAVAIMVFMFVSGQYQEQKHNSLSNICFRFCCSKCLLYNGPFCHGARHVYIVRNIYSLNISSFNTICITHMKFIEIFIYNGLWN